LDKVADEGYRSLTAVSRETCRNWLTLRNSSCCF
jgi:hypothetical protein